MRREKVLSYKLTKFLLYDFLVMIIFSVTCIYLNPNLMLSNVTYLVFVYLVYYLSTSLMVML